MYRQMFMQMDRLADYGWIDSLINGQTDRWMNGRIDRQKDVLYQGC